MSARVARAAFAGLFALTAAGAVRADDGAGGAPCTRVEVYSRAGCPHCADARVFLDALAREHDALEVVVHDVERDLAARARLEDLVREHGLGAAGVPTFVTCGTVSVGFRDAATTGRELRARLGLAPGAAASLDVVELPLFGRVQPGELGLPLFTVLVGLVDGFNPCAMWVLLFLLSILVNLGDRRRILAVAGTFVVVSGLVYYAFMAAWLSVFRLVGISRVVEVGLGVVALGIGAVHVKDFFAWGRGPSLSIPESAKPGLYARVRAIVTAERLGAAVASAAVLALAVNVVELLCTAGLPALYTKVLAMHALPAWQHYAYLALYDAAYVFDDALMVGVVVVTMSRRKLTERGGRWLKLVSGTVIALLGALLILAPDALVF